MRPSHAMLEKCLARFPDLPSAWANIIDRIDFQPRARGRAQVGGGVHVHVRRRPCVGVRSLHHVQAKAVEISIEACSLKSQCNIFANLARQHQLSASYKSRRLFIFHAF